MEENEVKGRKVAIDIVKANIFAVAIMVVAAIVFLVPFFWLWKDKKPISELLGGFGDWSITFILVIVGIVVHELIHGLTWACYAKSGWKSISFGVMWKLLTPYCHCDEPMHICHPCHRRPFHWQSAYACLGNLFYSCSSWRHLDDVVADQGKSQEYGARSSF